MPKGDRTGPMGQGPVTGRKLGYCAGFDTPGYTKGAGMGMGRGTRPGRRRMTHGRGFGHGRNYEVGNRGFATDYPWDYQLTREDEIRMLKSRQNELLRSQKDIERRLEELGNPQN